MLISVALITAFGLIAIAGNKASPSLDIELPRKAENGTSPFINKVVTIIWGPQPGIRPIKTPINGINSL